MSKRILRKKRAKYILQHAYLTYLQFLLQWFRTEWKQNIILQILKIYMGPLYHFTFKVNAQYFINTIFPCIFNLLNYTSYYICLKPLYLYILSISVLQIVNIALQAEVKITMFAPCLGQHFISSEIISHLCFLVLNTLMCLLSYNCVVWPPG